MRIAFLIPHFFGGTQPSSVHGSFRPDARAIRRSVLDRAIFQIHSLFGPTYAALIKIAEESRRDIVELPNPHRLDFDIFVFTAGTQHLLAELECGPKHYRHVETDADSLFLGFECARWIKDHLGSYDLYTYLEDDIVLRDPLYFDKIELFNRTFEAGKNGLLLQPQRYEETLNSSNPADMATTCRVYLDYQSRTAPSFRGDDLVLHFAGKPVRFAPALNPHAGCYTVNNEQAARMAAHPDFLDTRKIYITPFDTAATAFIDRALKIYKPAAESLPFLEVQHGHPGIVRLKFEA
jgi:hypothetical protein